jgi:segregation and condensation protein B
MRTHSAYATYLQQLGSTRPLRLSNAALETLAIVAYRQPVTRAEVEHVRGVDAGPVLRGLLERKLIKMAGHRDVPGRPMLYATTKRFLEVFGLDELRDLPTLRELESLEPAAVDGSVGAEIDDTAQRVEEIDPDDEIARADELSLDDVEILGRPH